MVLTTTGAANTTFSTSDVAKQSENETQDHTHVLSQDLENEHIISLQKAKFASLLARPVLPQA